METAERPTWTQSFLAIAKEMSKRSKDPSTKVGSVLVGPDKDIRAVGYNGFPRGVREDIPARWLRPEKYLRVEHSERNVLYACAREGISTKGCALYTSWVPCADCARGIIQSGVVRVVVDVLEAPPRWRSQFIVALGMLEEAGVEVCDSSLRPLSMADILWVGNWVRGDPHWKGDEGGLVRITEVFCCELGVFVTTELSEMFFASPEELELSIVLKD